MSDVGLVRRLASAYDQSYPPSLWGGGSGPPPTPVIDRLTPDTITAGTPQLVIVTGTGFLPSSVVWADEEAQITTHISSESLSYMAEADSEGAQDITVKNDTLVSNSVSLTVQAAAVEEPEGGEEPPPEEPPPEDTPEA
jgi:hypothetical protein